MNADTNPVWDKALILLANILRARISWQGLAADILGRDINRTTQILAWGN